MTDQSNAAQPGQDPIYDAIFILTEEADSLSECHTRTPDDWTGEPEAKARYDHVLAVVAALSKLRAEGVQAGDERALPPLPKPAILWHSDFTDQTYYGYTADHMRDYGRAALASAPVADQAVGSGRNMFYEGLFDDETERQRDARLRWANDMRAAFERHTGNGWFDKDWHRETGIWAAAWKAATADSAPVAGEAIYQTRRIGDGGCNWEDVTQQQYEAAKTSPAQRWERRIVYAAPQASEAVAELHIGVSATDQGATVCIMQPHADGSTTAIYSETHPLGDSIGLAALASAPVADESPMAKMADALREKARKEQQAYQDRRNQATEWGPMPEGTEADRPISIAPVAHVAGDETSRYLEWAKDRSAWEMPVGTPVYYSALASVPVADETYIDDNGKVWTRPTAWAYAQVCKARDKWQAAACAPVAGEAQSVAWENFPAYLIDHCEGDTITEEGLQHALSKMLADPKYAAPQASEAVRPDPDAIDLARAGMELHSPGMPEHTVCAELVRLADALKSQPQVDKDGGDCAKGAHKGGSDA